MSGSGPRKPPPPIPSKQSSSDQGSKGARVQIEVLCKFLLREFLNNDDDGISQAFEAYGDNAPDLYDNIIDQINKSPETMKSKRGHSRINNIFNEYAGTTLEERERERERERVYAASGRKSLQVCRRGQA